MSYEIFVSYSRKAPGICDEVVAVLRQDLGYHSAVFVDREDIPGGVEWLAHLRDAISEVKVLLLVATKEATEDPEFIRAEVREATERGIPIIPLEFDRDASKVLLGDGRRQYIKSPRSGDSCSDIPGLTSRLRRALTHRTHERLRERHAEATAWAARNIRHPSFWADSWRGYVNDSGPTAIIGPAGSGKTVIAAHHVQYAQHDQDLSCVLLHSDEVEEGLDRLAANLVSDNSEVLRQRLRTLAEHYGRRVLFIVDGLDQVQLAQDPKRTATVELLAFLDSAGGLIVTCRDDVWESTYAGHVATEVVTVTELDVERVVSHLPSARDNSLMRTPLFLDLAISRAARWRTIPDTDVDFFHRLFADIQDEGGGIPDSSGSRKQALLRVLALEQIRNLTYEIPLTTIANASRLGPAQLREAVNGLKRDRLLVERLSSGRVRTIRLAHDLLDCFSMADVVRRGPDRDGTARELCRRCEHECGWAVLSMLIRLGDDALRRALFDEFLRVLDEKRFGDTRMAQAWAVTYVLREQVSTVLPLVVEALRGERVASLRPDGSGGRGSELGVTLTQEAASSVASAFLALTTGDPRDSPHVVPVLERCLHRWDLKGRFIEALARYNTAEVERILVTFGTRTLETRDDLECLRYLAQGLARLEKTPELLGLLERIAADEDVDPVTRRRAYHALARLDGRAEPVRDEEEIIYGLRIDDDRGSYSDWDVVREYATYVHDQATIGRRSFSPAICRALIGSLLHEHVYVRIPAAGALGCFDDPMARDALLDQLLRDVLPTEIREASLDALKRQFDRIHDHEARQAFRFSLLYAAKTALERGSERVAADLVELATATPQWIVTPGALEATAPDGGQVHLSVDVSDGPGVSSFVQDRLAALGHIPTGPDLETKYRFAALRGGGAVEASLVPTTWSASNRFHRAVQQDPAWISHRPDGSWLLPLPFGEDVLPGVAVVHAVILTSDRQVVLAQRSDKVGYSPLHWSASFEEQLNERDFSREENPFLHAARRGFREEFGCEVEERQAIPLTTLMQIDLLNLGVVVLLLPDLTGAQIHEHWRSRAKDDWEARDVRWLPVDALLDGVGREPFTPLHCTSELRCQALARWLRRDPAGE
ncbi:hypothetical protein Aph01nite_24600 [Acrocarpospora phusangensis]|uniref:TIR domain-containing protein n=1 Tax=Acrocarpospora phusangensis TaxID=1070424 RepID=A0A919QB68_9ACTN|nr:TIR domain-containing protein [Acrocarpospora phusangensis]GIH24150.1 hypothetical protein Aph01nite_24600 [Acrocarpospora phusangensis]